MGSFQDFALVCQALGQTQSRLQMATLAGDLLMNLDVAEAAIGARFMIGQALPQGAENRLQLSGRAIWKVVATMTDGADQGEEIFAAAEDFGEAIEMLLRRRGVEPDSQLTLAEVARLFDEMAAIEGRNSRRLKLDALRDLFARATALEGKYLTKILIREMRHGLSEGLMLEAIARMAGRSVVEVRRLHMLEGDVGRVVAALRHHAAGAPPPPAPAADVNAAPDVNAVPEVNEGAASGGRGPASPARAPRTLRPLKPMLAQPAPNVAEAFRLLGDRLALEHKLDGARVQIHCNDGQVRIFSRRLNEITPSLPEIVEMMGTLEPRRAIFDGEVIAVDRNDGRALAFQELMRRFGRLREVERLRAEQPVKLFLFDLLGRDDAMLIDTPYEERYAALSAIANDHGLALATRMLPATVAEGEQFYARIVAAGFEGIVAKALASHYMPGVRGRGWLKIKHARTLDLVIVAADWGYGRRHGWLSNYHLAARDNHGGFVEVGKTFKGLTDDDFRAMTERLSALKTAESSGTVFVRPEVVVEVAYSDIQRSPQYDGGMALRFARIVGVRDDKTTAEADTIAVVAAAFDRQPVKPLG